MPTNGMENEILRKMKKRILASKELSDSEKVKILTVLES